MKPLTEFQERDARKVAAHDPGSFTPMCCCRINTSNPCGECMTCLLSAALATIDALRAERDAAWADTARQVAAAERLCEIYFNIAAELIGEDAVRVKRDAAIDAARSEAP